jgi:hypothetical protein
MILAATGLAIPKFRAAMRRRREEQKYVVNEEEKIFQIINAASQANRRAIESSDSS